jgi:hypothetical protein
VVEIMTRTTNSLPKQRNGIHPDLDYYAPNEAAFVALVETRLVSLESGSTYAFEDVEADIREMPYSKA